MHKAMKLNKNKIFIAILFIAAAFMQSCTENIDTSARYTATDPSIVQYLESDTATYGKYLEILKKVKINETLKRSSSVYTILSARGIYTVFAPTNQAITEYFDSLENKAEKQLDDPKILAKYERQLVMNSIIDKGDTDGELPYRLSDFTEGELSYTNLDERTVSVDSKNGEFLVNGKAHIIIDQSDVYAINGRIHTVDAVIATSDETAAEYLNNELEKTEDAKYKVMAMLLDECGLMRTLSMVEDSDYWEKQQGDNPIANVANRSVTSFSGTIPGVLPERRKYGFTIFAEPDSYWQSVTNKEPEEITLSDIMTFITGHHLNLDGTDTDIKNVKNKNNALYQFVCYHVLPEKLTEKGLVVHFNELGYDPTQAIKTLKAASCAVSDFYSCVGTERLMKIYESAQSNGIYINRFPVLDNGRTGTGRELSCDATPYSGLDGGLTDVQNKRGNLIHSKSEEYVELNNARIYTIDGVLAFSPDVQKQLGNQRIRIEAASLFPELMNNNIRANESVKASDCCVGIPVSKDYQYLDNCYIMDGSNFYYLSGRQQTTSVWGDYQGDEINVTGQYELRVKLPHIPLSGDWEIRYGYQTPANAQRGMCQVYFGTNPDALPTAGIPLDLRMGGKYRYSYKDANGDWLPSILTWNQDEFGDDVEETNAETDKQLRNQGYMKGPRCFYQFTFDEFATEDVSGQTNIARYEGRILRKIIVSQRLEEDKTYYIKFKNVLDDNTKEFYFDYLEFCPKSVYNNPTEPEDVW